MRRTSTSAATSSGSPTCRPIRQHGDAVDLNTLVVASDVGALLFAGDINDWGGITGQAVDPTTGALVAFIAIVTAKTR